jgi:hypothetical protein
VSGLPLLNQLRNAGLTVTRTGDQLIVAPRDRLTDELRSVIRQRKRELLSVITAASPIESRPCATNADPWADCVALSPVQEAARQDVLAQLAANPTVKRSFVTRFEYGTLIVTLAVRGIGTCELKIPAERFDSDKPEDYAALVACLSCEGQA